MDSSDMFIYLLKYDGEVFYVGKTNDATRRANHHKRNHSFPKEFSMHLIDIVPKNDSGKREKEEIIKQVNLSQPLFNRFVSKHGKGGAYRINENIQIDKINYKNQPKEIIDIIKSGEYNKTDLARVEIINEIEQS